MKLGQIVNENPEWKKFYKKQRGYLFEKLDIGDDETYKILMIKESSKRQWIRQFVRETTLEIPRCVSCLENMIR